VQATKFAFDFVLRHVVARHPVAFQRRQTGMPAIL